MMEDLTMKSDKKKRRYFVLMYDGVDTDHVFRSTLPHLAARKAAVRGYKGITLRERGTLRVHMFKGTYKEVPKADSAPASLPDIIRRGIVKKIGVKVLRKG